MPHGKGTYGSQVGRPRKKGGLLQDNREQYSIGGIISRIATLRSQKYKLERELWSENMSQANQNKHFKKIEVIDKELNMLEKQLDEGSAYEGKAVLEEEMSDLAFELKNRGFSDDKIDKLLEEVFENRNYSELEEALSRTPKQEGGPIDDEMQEIHNNLMNLGITKEEINIIKNNTIASKPVRAIINRTEKEMNVEPGNLYTLINSIAKQEKREPKKTGGLLQDDREQYVGGGTSKMLSKGMSKMFLKKTKYEKKVLQEINEIEKFLLDNKYPEATIFTKQELTKIKKEIGADLEYLDFLTEFRAIKEGDIDYIKSNKKRKGKQEGGPMSMDDQMQMAMTIVEEPEMIEEEKETNMLPDNDMEDNYTRFIMDEALTEDEEDMLTSKLEQDEELAMLFDKVIDVAQEFAGSGPVEGPGSGVSDSIPARLSDGEFVFTAKATEQIGEDTLMSMMKEAEAQADQRQELAMGGTPLSEEEKMLEEIETSDDSKRVARKISDNMMDPYTQDRYVRS